MIYENYLQLLGRAGERQREAGLDAAHLGLVDPVPVEEEVVRVEALVAAVVVQVAALGSGAALADNLDLSAAGTPVLRPVGVQQDPDFLRQLFHSSTTLGTLNRSGYKNPQYDDLADQQTKAVDEASRNRILGQMQDILARDMPAYPVFYPDDIVPYKVSAFDRWVYYKGTGILNKATFIAPK